MKYATVSLIIICALPFHAIADQPAKPYVSLDMQTMDIVGNLPYPFGESRLHVEYEVGEVIKVDVDSDTRSWKIPFKLISSYEKLSSPSLRMTYEHSSAKEDISILVVSFEYGNPYKVAMESGEFSICTREEWVKPVVEFLLMPDGSVNAMEISLP